MINSGFRINEPHFTIRNSKQMIRLKTEISTKRPKFLYELYGGNVNREGSDRIDLAGNTDEKEYRPGRLGRSVG